MRLVREAAARRDRRQGFLALEQPVDGVADLDAPAIRRDRATVPAAERACQVHGVKVDKRYEILDADRRGEAVVQELANLLEPGFRSRRAAARSRGRQRERLGDELLQLPRCASDVAARDVEHAQRRPDVIGTSQDGVRCRVIGRLPRSRSRRGRGTRSRSCARRSDRSGAVNGTGLLVTFHV
jgi:hypothetical protein